MGGASKGQGKAGEVTIISVTMRWIVGLGLVAAWVLFTILVNRRVAKVHARFQVRDVEEVLAELASTGSQTCDNWDQFLAWPIDDPYLDSIRQRCLTIDRECAPKHEDEAINEDGVARIRTLLQELRDRH